MSLYRSYLTNAVIPCACLPAGRVTGKGIWLLKLVGLLIMAGPPGLHAAGTVAAEFLRFPVGPAAGMAEAAGTLARDVTAIYWNPAGLGNIQGPSLYAAHNSLPLTLRQDFGAFAVPLPIPGSVGYSFQLLSQSALSAMDNTGAPAGNFSASDMAQTVGWGWSGESIGLGISLRYIRQALEDTSGSTAAGNIGVQYRPSKRWEYGAALSNVGPDLKLGTVSAPLPRTVRAGLGCHLLSDELLLAGEVSHVRGTGIRGHLGTQLRLYPSKALADSTTAPRVIVRAGYTLGKDHDDAYSGAAWGLTLGLRSFHADFSYQPFGDLGNSLQAGLGYDF